MQKWGERMFPNQQLGMGVYIGTVITVVLEQ